MPFKAAELADVLRDHLAELERPGRRRDLMRPDELDVRDRAGGARMTTLDLPTPTLARDGLDGVPATEESADPQGLQLRPGGALVPGLR